MRAHFSVRIMNRVPGQVQEDVGRLDVGVAAAAHELCGMVDQSRARALRQVVEILVLRACAVHAGQWVN